MKLMKKLQEVVACLWQQFNRFYKEKRKSFYAKTTPEELKNIFKSWAEKNKLDYNRMIIKQIKTLLLSSYKKKIFKSKNLNKSTVAAKKNNC